MPNHPKIYSGQADNYEALVSREDHMHHILPALLQITSMNDLDVVELGAGTGRLTMLLAPLVKSIKSFDISQHMLDTAQGKLVNSGLKNWDINVGDHRNINVADHSADVVISGWSICYIVVDNPDRWKMELDRTFHEIRRIIRKGGYIILLETLGTGFETPEPPPHLLGYYEYLKKAGFQQTWIRTDYQFESMDIARSLSKFFFGDSMAEKIINSADGVILPECTGIWWRKNE